MISNKVILILFLSVIILCGFICFCSAVESEARLGDSGKCGRDCIYYVCHRFGQQVTLDEIDQQLLGRENITFADIRKTFEKRGFFCKSFLFNTRNIARLQTNLEESDKQLYAIAALPASNETDHHFVLVVKCVGTQMTVFDVSNNKTGTINLANFKGKTIIVPVILVSTQTIYYRMISRFEKFTLFFCLCLLVAVIILFYFFMSGIQIKNTYRTLKTILLRICCNNITYRCVFITGIILIGLLLLFLLYREHRFHKSPLTFAVPHIELGDIELFTKNEIDIEIKNRSFQDIPIEDIQVSCSCLKIENYPDVIKAKSSNKIKLSLFPLLEGNVLYQILIVPQTVTPLIGKISYHGFQHVRVLPKYYNIGMINKGEPKTFTCEFSLKDLREQSFTITSIRMQGENPIFEVIGDLPKHLKNDEIFSITVKHLGNAPPGNFLQSFEIRGKGNHNSEEVILQTNLVGLILSEN
jgi:hypothetical protein